MRRSQVLTFIVLLLAAFALRYAVADRAIWFDERFTLANTETLAAAMEHCLRDVHPPLYFVLMAGWRAALPSTELSMRLLSVAFGMISLVGIFLVGRAISGWRGGVAALAIAAVSPYHWLYSTELRPYPMFLAFSALSTWGFLEALKTEKLKYFVLLAVFTSLNLYTHYFAVFLLMVQALVFLVVALRGSATGDRTAPSRNRLFLLGGLTLAAVVIAYAPWANVLRRLVTESVVEGAVVGAGRRLGQGVTLKLISTSFFDSMGQGTIPFILQALLVAFALTDRRFRTASLLFLVAWIMPFLMLKVWKPGHFIAAKYFIFSYPITVGMAGAGLASAVDVLGRTRVRAGHAFWLLLLVVSLSPLLPGQHKPYAFHRSDWKDVVSALEAAAGEGDRLSFPADTKAYAMVIHYTDEEFLKKHRVILWRPQEGAGRFNSLEPGSEVWLLKHGKLPPGLQADIADRVEKIDTWHVYPGDVSLYRFTAGEAGPGRDRLKRDEVGDE